MIQLYHGVVYEYICTDTIIRLNHGILQGKVKFKNGLNFNKTYMLYNIYEG